MDQPKGYVSSEYLDMVRDSVKHLKQRTYELMQLRPGQKALDVGCGPASDTLELGVLVGPQGEVWGVDYDQAMVDEAERRARAMGIAAWVKHQHAESTSLPFASDSFDACRSERLFQHLIDPGGTLKEMVRVTRRGGWIVVLDTDWGTASMDTTETDVERRLMRVHADMAAHNGYAGRQLYRLFKQQDMADVHIEVHCNWSTSYAFTREATLLSQVERIALEAGVVTEQEVRRLRTQMEQADVQGTFFGCANQMLVAGRKP